MIHTAPHGSRAQGCCAFHPIHACDERFSSTLSPLFPSTSSSSHSSFISCTSCRTSSTSLRFVANLCTPPEREWTLLTTPTPFTGYEPKAYDLKETYVESYTESLTPPQFSKQGFLEDVVYDDTALEEMLRETHRVHVHHSQREDLYVGQSSSVSERTQRPVGERTERLVGPIGRELNVANAQIRTLLDRQQSEFSPNVRRKPRSTNSRLIMTEVYEN